MNLAIYKYQGTGNDFVIIDNREKVIAEVGKRLIQKLCDRRFGIGADGVIFIQRHDQHDFEMVYFNPDGVERSFCGNGARCAVAIASHLGIIQKKTTFMAIDGAHEAKIIDVATATPRNDWVSLKMLVATATPREVTDIEIGKDYYLLDTGSPHYVIFVEDVQNVNVIEQGRKIRYNDRFKKEGVNVNFVQKFDDHCVVRTYERGVEDETFSCGTGVVAAAICNCLNNNNSECRVRTKGGDLKVRFERGKTKSIFVNIWLEGPAELVFKAEIEIGVRD